MQSLLRIPTCADSESSVENVVLRRSVLLVWLAYDLTYILDKIGVRFQDTVAEWLRRGPATKHPSSYVLRARVRISSVSSKLFFWEDFFFYIQIFLVLMAKAPGHS